MAGKGYRLGRIPANASGESGEARLRPRKLRSRAERVESSQDSTDDVRHVSGLFRKESEKLSGLTSQQDEAK